LKPPLVPDVIPSVARDLGGGAVHELKFVAPPSHPDPSLTLGMTSRQTRRRFLGAAFLLLLSCAEPSSRSVVDGVGRTVNLPPRIERIVTLAPNVTELVAYAGAGGRIVGTDSMSNFPREIVALPDVGGLQPSVEAIAALEPDLVIASTAGNPPAIAQALGGVGIPLYALRTDRVADLGRALRALGPILEVDGAGAAARLETKIASQRRVRARRPLVMVVLWPEPLYVAGRNTFLDDLLQIAGAENAVAVDGWPAYSTEAVIRRPPDIIVYPRAAVPAEAMRALGGKAAWRDVPAFRHGAVHPIADDTLMRPGPRVAEGLAELNGILDRWSAR
jgi:iron complex transport system substrate-binding protein